MPARQQSFSSAPAYADLGLGDALKPQLQDQEDEQKRQKFLGTRSAASMLGLSGSGTGY